MAHEGWSGAAGEGAVPVSYDEGGPDRGRDEAAEPADVEDLTAVVPRTVGMISASQARRRRTSGGRSVPSAVVPVVNIACSTVTRSRAGVPWVSGGRPVFSACWAVATRASHIRAPWSRRSRPSSQASGSAGWGAVSGSRAALIRAPSSAEPRPRIRTPPARSSVIERYRSRWAARSSRSQLGFESAVDGVGVDDLGDVPAGFGELGGVEVTGLADQDLLPATPHQVSRTAGLQRSGR